MGPMGEDGKGAPVPDAFPNDDMAQRRSTT